MKKFLEEYGFVILAVIVIICLIAISNPIEDTIQSNINKIIKKFSNVATDKFDMKEFILIPNQIIKIKDNDYVILQNRGDNKYLVMSTRWTNYMQFNETKNNIYENSKIDNYLNNEYFNSLPKEIKEAIIPVKIRQKFYIEKDNNENIQMGLDTCEGWCYKQPDGSWKPASDHKFTKNQPGKYAMINESYFRNDGYVSNELTRNIFIPSVDEISSIINVNDQYDMWKLMTNLKGQLMWFRDSLKNNRDAIRSTNRLMSLIREPTDSSYVVTMPTFVIDLNKIDFTEEGCFIK